MGRKTERMKRLKRKSCVIYVRSGWQWRGGYGAMQKKSRARAREREMGVHVECMDSAGHVRWVVGQVKRTQTLSLFANLRYKPHAACRWHRSTHTSAR